MKSKIYKVIAFSLVLAGTIALSNCSKEETATPTVDQQTTELKAGNTGPSASGNVIIRFDDLKRHFLFTATMMPDGSVMGDGVVFYSGGEKVEFDIDCMYIEGNIATMSGIVTSGPLEGTHCWLRVVDNGPGSNTGPDQSTLVALVPPDGPDCTGDPGPTQNYLMDILSGNIRIKP